MNEIRLYPWELDDLREYSTTNPSGVIDFKMWKRNLNAIRGSRREPDWVVCQYVPTTDPDRVATRVFRVVLKSGPVPRATSSPDWDNYSRWRLRKNVPWTFENRIKGGHLVPAQSPVTNGSALG